MTKRNRAPIGSLQHDFERTSPRSTGTGSSGIRPEQRFTKERPCPVCGGHRALTRGAAERCYGFVSADGEWAHCTREQYAKGLQRNASSGAYAHHLVGECLCGSSHAAGASQQTTAKASSTPNAVYRYEDESGELLFEVRRSEGKRFLVFRPTPKGFIPKLGGARKVLYRLREVRKGIDRGDTVFVVEGEKDVDTLASVGLTGTCNPFGAGKFLREYAALLAGAKVVIVPDADDVGREHAADVAQKLMDVAAEVRVLDLDSTRSDGYDISDFCALARTPRRAPHLTDRL
jgi:5S rRNA maturation endonuclease (ribonuclease M5)